MPEEPAFGAHPPAQVDVRRPPWPRPGEGARVVEEA